MDLGFNPDILIPEHFHLIASHTVSLEEVNEYPKFNIIGKCAVNVTDVHMFAKLWEPYAQAMYVHMCIDLKQAP